MEEKQSNEKVEEKESKVESKTWEGLENGDAKIFVISETDISIPLDKTGKNMIKIGRIKQNSEQIIEKEKLPILREWINGQLTEKNKQLEQFKDELKKYENIDTTLIPQELIQKVAKSIEKGTKAMKKQFVPLNTFAQALIRKEQLVSHIAFIENETKPMQEDINNIDDISKVKIE